MRSYQSDDPRASVVAVAQEAIPVPKLVSEDRARVFVVSEVSLLEEYEVVMLFKMVKVGFYIVVSSLLFVREVVFGEGVKVVCCVSVKGESSHR